MSKQTAAKTRKAKKPLNERDIMVQGLLSLIPPNYFNGRRQVWVIRKGHVDESYDFTVLPNVPKGKLAPEFRPDAKRISMHDLAFHFCYENGARRLTIR